MSEFNYKDFVKSKAEAFKNSEGAKKWFSDNFELIKKAFKDKKITDFIFEPFKDVLKASGESNDAKIKSVITQVAVANMVLAGLPGKLGVGVFVSMGLEAWMALAIAKQIGVKVEKPNDIFKYFGILSGILFTILVGFKQLLGFAFSLFSVVPFISPLILAELAITNLVGILFWFGFQEAKEKGEFKIRYIKSGAQILSNAKDLTNYQYELIKNNLSKENFELMGKRLSAWFKGDITQNQSGMRGEAFHVAAMIYLIQGKYDSLNGPLGKIFIDSIRRGYSTKLGDATLEEMSEYFKDRTPEQLQGDVSLVKGEMFESLIEKHENNDGDEWIAKLHEDRTNPGTDIVFTDIETGEVIEVQLKSVSTPSIIENALEKYPNVPIITTSEMEQHFGENPFISYSDIANENLEKVTEENFKELVDNLEPINTSGVIAGGVTMKALGSLWPFVMAYVRKRITYEQLEEALEKGLGDSGVSLASRLGYGVILGPVFAWYLLAKGVLSLTRSAESSASKKRILSQA